MYNAGILNRDISVNGIFFHAGGHTTGIIIGFDMAVRVDREERSGAVHRTGTFDFMALDFLRPPEGHKHNALHDLESFFYVLLWVAIKYQKGGKPNHPPSPQTVFYSPPASDSDPFKTAYAFKNSAVSPKDFRRTLAAVGGETRRLLSRTMGKWLTVTFPRDDSDGEEWDPEGEDVEDSGPKEGDATKLALKIEKRYDEVLQLPEYGIKGLNGA